MNMAERKIEMISNFIQLKPAHMKYLIPVLSAAMVSTLAYGQFEGVLHYECTLKNQVVMTVYLSPLKARVEAKIIPLLRWKTEPGRSKRSACYHFRHRQQKRNYPECRDEYGHSVFLYRKQHRRCYEIVCRRYYCREYGL